MNINDPKCELRENLELLDKAERVEILESEITKLRVEEKRLKAINAELLAACQKLLEVTAIEPPSDIVGEDAIAAAAEWIYNVRCVRCDPDFIAAIAKAQQGG